ncbi:FAD/NAD(P)-binding domain-containing protein [Wilcoxina mikolae CBS 423.85]|nr:FAD/NAD(P)-binding domain-containing protein [Wilcoxina mikolae CBS 423.85]
MGIQTLVVDRNKRVGDNWRKRYHQLVLHDPVQYDHMPYLNFPANWPTFTPKDKLGDWFEFYASALELNVWTESEISASSYDEKSGHWNITISRPSGTRELQPRHIILATGHSGEPNVPDIDTSSFKGDVICHSSAFPGAKRDGAGRKAVVVGCCNSGHDIAQGYYEKGYDVTIVQRSSTYVMSSENGLGVLLKGLYDEDGPPVEDADLLFMANPIPLFKRNQIYVTQEIERRDAPILDGLVKAGFTLDKGPDDSGFFMKYLERGGGYYLDVGASHLIATSGIKIKKISSISEITPNGIRFDEASGFLEADEIVFATGYANMKTTAEKILGKEVVEGVEEVWGVDGESGEIRGMWKMARPGLWFMGGNLALTRWFSRMVAIGVAAREGGLVGGF